MREWMQSVGERVRASNPWAFLCLGLAAFLTYGADWIVRRLLKIEGDRAYSHRIAIKTAGLATGIIGLLILMDII
jgi:hypothetical protein